MSRQCRFDQMLQAGFWKALAALAACLLLGSIVAAQGLPVAALDPDLAMPARSGVPLEVTFPQIATMKANNFGSPAGNVRAMSNIEGSPVTLNASVALPEVRRITLDEAQQMATGSSNPLVRLAALQVRAAKEHRLGVQSEYFPNIGGQLENLHFNKNTGPVLTLDRLGVAVPVDIIGKNQTAFNFSAIQPVTPLFAVHQLVKVARADETIARAKAGVPAAETASKVEKNYFDLMIAQRELLSAEAESRKIQVKWLSASSSGAPESGGTRDRHDRC